MSQFRLLSGTAAVLVGSALVYSYTWKAPQAPEAAAPQSDLLEPVAHFAGRIYLVVSNPPYFDPADRCCARSSAITSRLIPCSLPATPCRSTVASSPPPPSSCTTAGRWRSRCRLFDPTQGGSNNNSGPPTPGCTAFALQFGSQRGAVFDPDVVYDEAEDRFVIGIDGAGENYCVAASQTGDPTGGWYRYGFPTDVNGAFFDFPHMGVGVDAVYMGSNQFGGSLPFGFQGRVFAMDKSAMYNGAPLTVPRPRKSLDLPPRRPARVQ